jgi:hypothetical protein
MSNAIEYDEYDLVMKICERRFPSANFHVSCFDTVQEIADKVLNYCDETIVIAYYYRRDYFDNLGRFLQDIDYFTVTRRQGESCIYYSDVIDAIIGNELAGNIKPQNCSRYLETIDRIDSIRGVPTYTLFWGS